jgi:hypothetical protein
VEPHLALELTERLIRLSLESTSADDTDGDEEMELDENGVDNDCQIQSIAAAAAAAGCWMLDARCWMLDAGCWMLDVSQTFLSISVNCPITYTYRVPGIVAVCRSGHSKKEN